LLRSNISKTSPKQPYNDIIFYDALFWSHLFSIDAPAAGNSPAVFAS
jgi:hypothetical protein